MLFFSVSSDEVGPGQLRRQGSNPTQNASESSVDLSVGALIRSPQSRALKEELDKYKNECGNLKQQVGCKNDRGNHYYLCLNVSI